MSDRSAPRIKPGFCSHCGLECRDALGSEIYPGRRDLAEKVVWVCDNCGARVGSHPNGKPLGTAANAELRRAREHVHEKFDPIWKNAPLENCYAPDGKENGRSWAARRAAIQGAARVRCYRWLANRMGMSMDDCHIAMMTIEECRKAWRILSGGITYPEIRAWAKAQKEAKQMGETRIERLKNAIEGECDGLAISDEQAEKILEWVDGRHELQKDEQTEAANG